MNKHERYKLEEAKRLGKSSHKNKTNLKSFDNKVDSLIAKVSELPKATVKYVKDNELDKKAKKITLNGLQATQNQLSKLIDKLSK